MIDLKDINISFDDKPILKNITLNFKKGKFSAVVGPNGCGKTTMIKVIASLLKEQSGHIMIDGQDKRKYAKKELAQKIAFLMQFKEITHDFNVEETVAYGRQPYLKAFGSLKQEDYKIIEWALQETNTQHLRKQMVNTLSGGEKQRVFLALALCQQPDILVLDEPTNHLDLKYQYEILKLVRRLNLEKKLTVICVLHDLNQAMRFADEIIVMKDGQIIHDCCTNKSINEALINHVYDIKCCIHRHDNHKYIEVI